MARRTADRSCAAIMFRINLLVLEDYKSNAQRAEALAKWMGVEFDAVHSTDFAAS